MKVLTLEIEVEYDDNIMHSRNNDKEAKRWFFDDVLNHKNGLTLYSNEVGDTVGKLTRIKVLKGRK
jgi:hypothetical protein